ncbi:glycosyltransferase family 2 protein [Polynucleobacter corsicus]|uniref:glycosyltransferase family 2 protein n=1 Tax=Polynucleobacter corsicus TaxID=2081042 RepID=UPI001BFDBE08|nr:glycosyltransferase family A protein [Polynucleobacter corsicus]QWE18960.1 glycosyltransferase family 2 protein [Polynucleobacter corsicus]
MTSPKASVILLTYNQEQFVEEALLSLLNQDMDDLEIVVSDDCSSDSTWGKIQVVVNAYSGHKKVVTSRNASNLGIVANYAAGVKKSSGDLIFMAAGDDISLPNRCSGTIQFWRDTQQQYDLVAADAFDMAYDGTILDSKKNDDLETWTVEKWFESRPFFFGASHMVSRRLLNLAPLNSELLYEDQCLVFRAILMGGAIRLPINLVCHRRGGMSQTMGFKFGNRRSDILRHAANELAEVKQFMSDATLLGKQSLIETWVTQKVTYLTPIVRLFQGPVSPKAFGEFWSNETVSVEDKRRYSRYYFLYPVLAIAHAVRDSLRMLRRDRHTGHIQRSKV